MHHKPHWWRNCQGIVRRKVAEPVPRGWAQAGASVTRPWLKPFAVARNRSAMQSPPLDALDSVTRRYAGFVIERIRILDTFSVPPHGHDGRHLMIVTEGAIVESGTHGEREATRGTARFSPVSELHTIEVVQAPFACVLITLHPDAAVPFPERRGLVSATPLVLAAESVANLIESDAPGDRLRLAAKLPELMAQSLRVSLQRPTEIPAWLTFVCSVVEASPARPPSLRSLARDAGVHPVHLSRAFRTHYGRTLRDFVRERRLQAAVAALERTSATISSIAAETGFADHAHLTRVTRAYTGITPGEIRRSAKC